MGVLANYPIAQAPAMGHNFFFAFAAVPIITLSLGEEIGPNAWQVALGAVFISGVLFLILSLTPFMRVIIQAVPDSAEACHRGRHRYPDCLSGFAVGGCGG